MKTYIIAEIGINHNGDINLAKELIDIASKNDCQAIKLQKRDIESVYTQEELNKFRESPWGTTNRQQKEGLEFDIKTYQELEKYSNDKGLDFIVSCWDLISLDLIEKHCNVKYHKVASALLTNIQFLETLNTTNKPIILSTGMSNDNQIKTAVDILENIEYLLACTSSYPTPDTEVNLKNINTLQSQYPNLKIGFSNHSNGILASIGAVALGATCVEFHITKDRTAYGSDQSASIENVNELVNAIRKMEKLLGNGIKIVHNSETAIKNKLRRSEDF